MKALSPEQQQWVESSLQSMSPRERVAQLLIPKIHAEEDLEALLAHADEIPFGGLFVTGGTPDDHRRRLSRVQSTLRIPAVVAADLENGAGYVIRGTTPFPDILALAAADDADLAYRMGECSAVEGRAVGIHWTYAPVVDVNLNPDNPIANTRSLGDDVERIGRLAAAIIRGMQDHGLAACAKHFPGDGIDDVDQHATTSVNGLPLETWKSVSGRTFAAAFAADVLSVMIGHIALPAWDPETDARGALRPATLSRRITTGLLREAMGFDGLIVTDDMNMGGAAGYMNQRDRAVHCILAGCDMLLFPTLPRDFDHLLRAAESGELPGERIDDACRRILAFKARLGLHAGHAFAPEPTAAQRRSYADAAAEVARRSIAKVRDSAGLLPLQLAPGARVVTVTLTNDGAVLTEVDRELEARGFRVEHVPQASYAALDSKLASADAIFVNFSFKANWAVGSVRSIGPHNRVFMNGFFLEHPRVVFTSFGSPYHLRQFSTLPNFVNVHSDSLASQRAAVAAWLGEIPMSAKSPVGNLERKWAAGGRA